MAVASNGDGLASIEGRGRMKKKWAKAGDDLGTLLRC